MPILSRLITIMLGYFAGLVTFLVALILIFSLLAAMSPQPGLWMLGPISPAIFMGAPVALVFTFVLALTLSLLPFLLILALSEYFGWRSPIGYCSAGFLGAAGAYAIISPRFTWGANMTGIVELVIFGLSGLIGGGTYWLIAGRKAGKWRRTNNAAA